MYMHECIYNVYLGAYIYICMHAYIRALTSLYNTQIKFIYIYIYMYICIYYILTNIDYLLICTRSQWTVKRLVNIPLNLFNKVYHPPLLVEPREKTFMRGNVYIYIIIL